MKLVITTQYQENYGAHDWDGEGECPQYWKFKGGSEFMVDGVPRNIPLDEIVDMVRGDIETDNDYCRESILGYRLEEDDYLSEFERSQLEYEGQITFKEPRVQYADMMAKHLELKEVYFGA
jgi:hypothetical protein